MVRRIGPVAEEARDIILLMDSRGQICDANRAALVRLRLQRSRSCSGSTSAICARHEHDDIIDSRWRAPAPTACSSRPATCAGRQRAFPARSARAASMLDGESFLVSVIRDLSERRRAEATLRETENLFSKVFHNSPVVVSIVDLADQPLHRRQRQLSAHLRPVARRGARQDLDELGRPSEPPTPSASPRHRSRRYRGEFEVRIRARDGRMLDTIHSLEFIELQGRPCVVAFAHDITEHKRLEQQLQHAQKHGGGRPSRRRRRARLQQHPHRRARALRRSCSTVLDADSPHRRHADQIHRAALRAARADLAAARLLAQAGACSRARSISTRSSATCR